MDRCDTRLTFREGNALFLQPFFVCISLHSSFLSVNKEIKTDQSWCCVYGLYSLQCIWGGLDHNIFLISIDPWLLMTVYMHASYLLITVCDCEWLQFMSDNSAIRTFVSWSKEIVNAILCMLSCQNTVPPNMVPQTFMRKYAFNIYIV